MSSSGGKVRAVAAEIIDAVAEGGRSLDAAIAEREVDIAAKDRSLLRMICYGSLRQHWQLQFWVQQLIRKPLRKRDRVVNSLLACAFYQMIEMRIPDHAVVSETVEATRQLRRPKLAGLVNACLRRFIREDIASRPVPDEQVQWNHPTWLIECIRRDWPDHWQAILEANNQRAPMWLRVNSAKLKASDYCEQLRALGISAETRAELPDAVCLSEPCAVDALPGFADGCVSVQDGAAQIAARWLQQCRPDSNGAARVLDACAAPGGKTGHLLELGGSNIDLLAIDTDAQRLGRIAENLERLDLDATIIAADASNPEEWSDGRLFDGILLDAPCSASGVIRRHPDIKLLRRESDLDELAALQGAILKALWTVLAPGGCLLYATCSVLARENDDVLGAFLRNQEDATEKDLLPNNNIRDLMQRKACGYQILPGTAALDGFYYACLQKKKVS
tara:strand:+ start:4613 stop:5956 length:1344 start_codon:yes stop_codon:yes gene_type:complete